MRRTLLRWGLMALFVAVLGFVFVNLGGWQLDRLDQRRERNATVVAHEQAPVLPFAQVWTPGREITDGDQWQRVEVRGRFLDQQVQARYRSFDNRTGWELITPLEVADGRTVLIDRGFVERPAAEDFPSALPAPPSGEVTLIGYVRRNERGNANQITPSADTQNTVRLINSEAIAGWLGRDLVNGFVSLIEITPAQSGDLEPITPPPPDEGPHASYAVQWYMFAAIAVGGLVVLIRNDIVDRRKARARREAQREPGPPTPPVE